jgi:regulator of protease activity HflC (stomatin/prohibitin superfamily)
LRDVIGQSELDELLAHREELNQRLQRIIDATTDPWGIKVDMVAIKDVELPDTMKRVMARQAEAERERRAKVIHAQGEFQAAETLAQAAEIMGRHPGSLQLRFLQTLTEVATERSTIVVMPVPIDILVSLHQRPKADGNAVATVVIFAQATPQNTWQHSKTATR